MRQGQIGAEGFARFSAPANLDQWAAVFEKEFVNFIVMVVSVLCVEEQNVPADRFLSAITEHQLGTRVPARDIARHVHGNYRLGLQLVPVPLGVACRSEETGFLVGDQLQFMLQFVQRARQIVAALQLLRSGAQFKAAFDA